MVWLHQVKRLWVRGNLSDAEVLLIAASHLKGQVELWWVPLEDSIITWEAFEEAFRARFISVEHQEAWWSKIAAVKQGEGESVEDVAYKLQELFSLVGSVEESYQVCHFTQAINPTVAYRMEESAVATTWKEAIDKAVRIENAQKKYLASPVSVASQVIDRKVAGGSQAVVSDAVSSTLGPGDSVSQTHTLLTQVADTLHSLQLQLGSQQQPSRTPPNFPPRGPPRCWNCGQDGHISSRCPTVQQQQGQGQNQGNGSGRQ